MNFSAFPLLRLALCFALGIVAYHYLGDGVLIQWQFLLFAFGAYLFFSNRGTFKYQSLLAILAFFLLFGLGAYRLASFKGEHGADHLIHLADTIQGYKAQVVDIPEIKEKRIACKLEVYGVLINNEWASAKGRVSAYLDIEKGTELHYGDLLFVKGSPALTSPPANPGEFDYRQYLIYNRIHHQQFIGDQFTIIGADNPNWFVSKANQLRAQSTQIITSYITDEAARGVMLALVLGVKDDLQDEVIQAFSATGAMHVLAVSGLHVGIIYALVFFVLKKLGLSKRKYRWWLAILSLITLWSYALLTGLSPSVLRAVTMFSFIAIGQALSRKTNIYNTLAASAMALLIYNPYLIMSVGFQLSYLAVFGIVYIQPKLYERFEFRHWLWDKVWAITCVSIAAQLATAPLSILYFHQFPSYFLLSNLFIIPSAFIALSSGLVLLGVSAVPAVAVAFGWLVNQFIVSLNMVVFWLSELPGSTVNGIYVSILDTWLIYGLLCCLVLFFVKKKFVYAKCALGLTLAFAISQVWHFSQFTRTSEFSVMNVSASRVLDFRSGLYSQMVADSLFTADLNRQRFHLHPKRLLMGSPQNPENDKLNVDTRLTQLGKVFSFEGKRILCLDQKAVTRINSTARIEVDWLILSENVLRDLTQLKGKISFEQLIIDPTNSWYTDRRLVNQADSLNINYHSIRQDGYFSKRWKKTNL